MFGGWGETEASVPPPLAPKGGLGGGWRVEEDTVEGAVGGGGYRDTHRGWRRIPLGWWRIGELQG